ncbi:MAG: metallophosphoesterase [Bryobacteraceae bacterium]
MVFVLRHRVEFIILVVTLAIQMVFGYWALQTPGVGRSRFWRRVIVGVVALLCAWLCAGVLLDAVRVTKLLPETWVSWVRGGAIVWALLSMGILPAWFLIRCLPKPKAISNPSRRHFMQLVRTALIGAPTAALGYGVFVQRAQFSLREVDLRLPNLPKDLDGLRLVQVSDIHLSPFLSRKDLDRNVAMANETRAHIALVTGDLITTRRDPVDACIERLAQLRSDAGTFGCLGNHEVYAGIENYVTRQGARHGIRFLRREFEALRFGGSTLRLTGVDYQKFGGPYLTGAQEFVDPAAFNILLSHNPDVFPVAVQQGYQLTISGHTHGGQVDVEILRHDLSFARFFTPYVYGEYRLGRGSVYVTRGIGTVGLPARLGAPPEVALIRLCAI